MFCSKSGPQLFTPLIFSITDRGIFVANKKDRLRRTNALENEIFDGFGRQKKPRRKMRFPMDFQFPMDISVGNLSGYFF